MTANGTETQLVGRVVSVNDKGLKLEGQETWSNFSKFAVGLVAPERGQYVTLTLDRSGFIRSVDTGENASGATPMQQTPQNGSSSQHRDRTITRLAVLKAAAEFGAARPNLKSGEILAIAASWERWVMREAENTLENVDAF